MAPSNDGTVWKSGVTFRMALDPDVEKRRLLDEVPIEPDVLDAAREELSTALVKLQLGPSPISATLMGMAHFAWTRTIDTLAVKLAGDGHVLLMANPDFVIKIGAQQLVMGLTHEAYHVAMKHVSRFRDRSLDGNPSWTAATEGCINWRIEQDLRMPLITDEDGNVIIVDPHKMYEQYVRAAKKEGLVVASKKEFYATDIGCFSYLDALPKPIQPKNMGACAHTDGGGEGDGQGDGHGGMINGDDVGEVMDKVLGSVVRAAANGRKDARDEILSWMDATPEAGQMWGDLGANKLRGETMKTRASSMWLQYLHTRMARTLKPGMRPVYNRFVPWDPRIALRGSVPRRSGAIFVDSSGSMPQAVIDKVATLVGRFDNVDVDWHWFDAEVGAFEPGGAIAGGGGTSFQSIEDHIHAKGKGPGGECCRKEPDFVLVLTDGYAPAITPAKPSRWVWLVTRGGDMWPKDQGMVAYEVDIA